MKAVAVVEPGVSKKIRRKLEFSAKGVEINEVKYLFLSSSLDSMLWPMLYGMLIRAKALLSY